MAHLLQPVGMGCSWGCWGTVLTRPWTAVIQNLHCCSILPAARVADIRVAGTSLWYVLEGESSSRPCGASLSQNVEASAIAKLVKAVIPPPPSPSPNLDACRREVSGQKLLLKIVVTLHSFPMALHPVPCAAFLAHVFLCVPSIRALLSAVCYQIMEELQSVRAPWIAAGWFFILH